MSNELPLASVIIPCYNVDKYVKKSILSIVNQTYKNIEIILVDDASTDNTLKIIRNINDNRIKIIALEKNTLKIGAVNTALQTVRGDLIAFQDADDWSEPDRIEKQVKVFLDDADLRICFTNYRYVNSPKKQVNLISLTDEHLKDEFLSFGNRKFTNFAPTMCATMMIRREVLSIYPGYHQYFAGRVAEDIYWVYNILKVYKGVSIAEPLYTIQQRLYSLTHNQLTGVNAKAAYTWPLLARIIQIEQTSKLDILSSNNCELLQSIELQACEEALVEQIKNYHKLRISFETSFRYRLGKAILSPVRFFKRLINLK
ncbi:glycosyltransferase family 2 protein [Pontibacter liquoris]|uniref:glycosyltransferase family 2 protein n=1 Tax=Pontibacter liquoris TaxID=2905677 RepID=UPI001FA713BB|nr:glycosyltransferase family 2 protein [Pontibacter liquoris]